MKMYVLKAVTSKARQPLAKFSRPENGGPPGPLVFASVDEA